MVCWLVLVIVVPSLYFGCRAATDFAPDPPWYWQRPSSYGQAVFVASWVWFIGCVSPALWNHRNAFDREDLSAAAVLGEELAPSLPIALGVLTAGGGVFAVSTAFGRRGQRPHCRGCGYERAPGGRRLTPICPECGRRWSWFGDAILGQPFVNGPRIAWGTLLAAIGVTAIILQFIN